MYDPIKNFINFQMDIIKCNMMLKKMNYYKDHYNLLKNCQILKTSDY